MFPIRTERDVGLVNWLTWATAFSSVRAVATADLYFKSDGLVYADDTTFAVRANVSLAAKQAVIAGVHLVGPLEASADYTLYSYNCTAWTVDPEISCALVVGLSAASPSTSATDTISAVRYLHIGHRGSSDVNGLEAEGVIGLSSPFVDLGAGFEQRGVCFGIAMLGGIGPPTAASHCEGRLSVRRLVGTGSTIHDNYKLG